MGNTLGSICQPFARPWREWQRRSAERRIARLEREIRADMVRLGHSEYADESVPLSLHGHLVDTRAPFLRRNLWRISYKVQLLLDPGRPRTMADILRSRSENLRQRSTNR